MCETEEQEENVFLKFEKRECVLSPSDETRFEQRCKGVTMEAEAEFFVKFCALVKSCGVSKTTPVLSKNRRKPVSVFLSTLQLTALILEKFRLRLHYAHNGGGGGIFLKRQ